MGPQGLPVWQHPTGWAAGVYPQSSPHLDAPQGYSESQQQQRPHHQKLELLLKALIINFNGKKKRSLFFFYICPGPSTASPAPPRVAGAKIMLFIYSPLCLPCAVLQHPAAVSHSSAKGCASIHNTLCSRSPKAKATRWIATNCMKYHCPPVLSIYYLYIFQESSLFAIFLKVSPSWSQFICDFPLCFL